jgi:hypothetical protein
MSRQPSDFFIFNFVPPDSGSRPEDVVAFTAGGDLEASILAEALRAHLDREPPPGRLFILGPAPAAERLVKVASSEDLSDALPPFTRWLDPPPVIPIAYQADGSLVDLKSRAPEVETAGFAAALRRTGLRVIFDAHTGMLRAPQGFHYANPSGRHTVAFIRTGSVLLHSAEVSFIAMGILRWWPEGVKRIFVDTASISSVAYALVDLRRMFSPDLVAPSIDSFSSYEGVGDFSFEPQDALCLISASTSGNLERQIVRDGHLSKERIVTLFYCGTAIQDGHILCDLTAREGVVGEEPISSFRRESDCEMCRAGSSVVHISGDQFLPADPEVTDVMLKAADAPGWLAGFLDRVVGQGIVRCHGGSPGVLREIYIDLENALSADAEFAKALGRRLSMALPASLETIVHVGDPSSRALAEVVRANFAAGSGRELADDDVLDINKVYEEEHALSPKGAVAVVAGVVSSGRALLGVSQYLRNVAHADSIVYIIGVARCASPSDWRRIESSVTMGEESRDYPLFAVTDVFLPGDRGPQGTPWELESVFLGQVRDQLMDDQWDDTEVFAEIEARQAIIGGAEASSVGGLIEDVFLPAVNNGTLAFDAPERLRLAPGFVYWRRLVDDRLKGATQAEVYVTILALLYSLRRGSGRGALVQYEHNRTVLAPANFVRFNDGVIQAAILRAALPRELDYTHDKILSGQMRQILTRFFEHMTGSEGKAAPEFLLALARGQLQLRDEDMAALRETLDRLKLPPLMRALSAWMGRGRTISVGSVASETVRDPESSGSPDGVITAEQ